MHTKVREAYIGFCMGVPVERNVERIFIATVQREGLLPRGGSVLAAVSGGGDSVALLHLLQRFENHMDWSISVLHIDHDIRESSGADACFVCDLATDLGLEYTLRKPQPPEGGSLEGEWSRIRHRIYEEEAAKGKYLVAVGHTASDRAETLLMRLIEGSGLRGLGGMDYVGRGPVRRPLLDVTGREAREYLESIGQQWLEDPTNMDPSILRNRIRLEVMPHIEGVQPGAGLGLARAAAGLSDWRRAAFEAVEEAVRLTSSGPGESVCVSRAQFRALPHALRLGMLWELSGRPRKGRFELDKTERWLSTGGCGSRDMPGGSVLTADPEEFRIEGTGKHEE